MAIAERQQPAGRTTIVAAAAGDTTATYLNWNAVLGGTAVTLAVSFVLTSFAAALGVALAYPWNSPASAPSDTAAFVLAVLLALVQIWAFATGGYLTGRMRPIAGDAGREETRTRDGMNGLVMWAVAVILLAILLSLTGALAGSLVTTGTGAAAATTATDAARQAGAFTAAWTSVLLLLCGGAAWWSAQVGGRHRDEGRFV